MTRIVHPSRSRRGQNSVPHRCARGPAFVTVQALLAAEAVRFVVSDQGPGVEPDELPYLFERFWKGDRARSRDAGGSGLGLSIVRQIVELHGGSLTLESELGAGTTVTVRFPPERVSLKRRSRRAS